MPVSRPLCRRSVRTVIVPGAIALFLHAAAAAAGPPAGTDEAAFLAENGQAMDRMMADMAIQPSGDIDRDFFRMMVPHHQGAIDMAKAELRHGRNPQLRRLAQEIIVTQQQEIAAMHVAVGLPPPPAAADPPPLAVAACHDRATVGAHAHTSPPMPVRGGITMPDPMPVPMPQESR